MKKTAIKPRAGVGPRKLIAGLVLAAVVAVGGSTAAFADATKTGGNVHCSFNIQTVHIRSDANGKVYHMVGGDVSQSWNNGSSYTWRSNGTGYGGLSSWGVISTGGIQSASTYCAV